MKQSAIWKNIRLFSWRSVFFRYLFSLMFIILLIFVPYTMIIYYVSDDMLASEISAQSSSNALKSKMIFDLLNSSFANHYALAADSTDAAAFLSAEERRIPAAETLSVQNLLRSIKRSDESVEEIMVYSTINKNFITTDRIAAYDGSEPETWINTYRASKLPFLMFPRKLHSDSFDSIFTVQELYDKAGRTIGIFCIQSRYRDFEEMVRQSFGEDPDRIFIVSDLGLILYSNEYSRINTLMFEDPDIYSAFLSAKETEGSTLFWGDSIISVAKSGDSDLILMSFTSRAKILGGYHWLNFLMGIGSMLVLLVAMISALFIAVNHYRSVSSVLRAIQDTEDPDALGKSRLRSEFFYIIHSVASSANKNQELDGELAETIRRLKHAQFCELQAQINPHFVFNTLQLINLSILRETHADTPATRLISLFSQLLHSAYDTDNVIVTVEEEIQNLRTFTEIQSIRYKGRLKTDFQIDEACLSYCTLKLMLQPFAENCMVHGFCSDGREWRLRMTCILQNGNLIFTISDNGCGIPPDQLREIRQKLKSPNIAGQNIGISNVNQRLFLLFGTRSSVQVDSKPGEGTSITIRHPARKDHPMDRVNNRLTGTHPL